MLVERGDVGFQGLAGDRSYVAASGVEKELCVFGVGFQGGSAAVQYLQMLSEAEEQVVCAFHGSPLLSTVTLPLFVMVSPVYTFPVKCLKLAILCL